MITWGTSHRDTITNWRTHPGLVTRDLAISGFSNSGLSNVPVNEA
jgi:hypothetical protein